MNALEGALHCATRGWPVYPLTIGHDEAKCDGGTANCKTSDFKGSWKKRATTDPEKIKRWKNFNAYLIDCEAAGIVVVDQDPGDTWPFNGTMVVASGRGFHHYYADGGLYGLPSTVGLKPWGVETRGVGGALFGPGSYHPHGDYHVVKDEPPALPPPELVAALQRRPQPSEAPVSAGAGTAYAALSPDLQQRADALQESRLAKWRFKLEASTEWAEGERGGTKRTGEERGWETLSRDFAMAVAVMAATDYLPMTYDEAEEIYLETLPEDYIDMDDPNLIKGIPTPHAVRKKIADGRLEPIGPPPWESEIPDGICKFEGCEEPIRFGRRGCDEHADEVEAESTGSTWRSQDVGAMLAKIAAGEVEKITPTVCRLDDGSCLFYPGRINTVFGESGSGKTWLALLAAKQEMEAGSPVVFIDFEDDLSSALLRLKAIGAKDADLTEWFRYIAPEEALSKGTRKKLIRALGKLAPTLVVIDSTGESLALEGKNPNADEDVASWIRLLPKACTGCGAAVVVVDHIPKADGNNAAPIGSQRKRAATYCAYRVDTVKSFAKGEAGSAKVVANKDKAGTYRRDDVVGVLNASPGEDDQLDLTLGSGRTTLVEAAYDERLLAKICDALEKALAESADAEWPGASRNHVVERVGGNAAKVRSHLARLVDIGNVEREKRGQTNYHTLVSRYVPDDLFEDEEQ